MNTMGTYYRDGHVLIDFDASKLKAAVDDARRDLSVSDDVPGGPHWRQKYEHTLDMRPSVLHDPRYIEALGDNSMRSVLSQMTASDDLTLAHCQVRWVRPRPLGINPSYMDWHRDTYIDATGEWVGNTPPVHKVIVYVEDEHGTEERLRVVTRSHRLMLDQPDMDIDVLNRNSMLFDRCRIDTVSTSNTRALLFNTSLLHAVIPEVNPNGSVRVIYSFATRRQLAEVFSGDPIHAAVNAAYETWVR